MPPLRITNISPKYDSLILVDMQIVQVEFGGGKPHCANFVSGSKPKVISNLDGNQSMKGER
jgi:hypothetical protein